VYIICNWSVRAEFRNRVGDDGGYNFKDSVFKNIQRYSHNSGIQKFTNCIAMQDVTPKCLISFADFRVFCITLALGWNSLTTNKHFEIYIVKC
jgi:hypothetical protein